MPYVRVIPLCLQNGEFLNGRTLHHSPSSLSGYHIILIIWYNCPFPSPPAFFSLDADPGVWSLESGLSLNDEVLGLKS